MPPLPTSISTAVSHGGTRFRSPALRFALCSWLALGVLKSLGVSASAQDQGEPMPPPPVVTAPMPSVPVISVKPVGTPPQTNLLPPLAPPVPFSFQGSVSLTLPPGAFNAKNPSEISTGEGTVLERWLKQVDSQFKSMFETEAEKPFQAALEEARKQYRQALETTASLALQESRPIEGEKLRKELDRFLAEKQMVPVEDTDSPAEPILVAREKFRSSITAAYKDRLSNALPVFQKYESVLAQNSAALLQRQMRTEANLLGAKKAEITRLWISQTSPYLEINSLKVPTPDPVHGLQTAIDWLLRSGGKLTVHDGNKRFTLVSSRDLGKRTPTFEELTFTGRKISKKLKDEDFVALTGLGSVRSVKFLGVPAGNAAFHFLRGWKTLEQLTIQTAMVTDLLADHLLQLPNLKTLNLENCRGITPQFLHFLEGALPNLEVLNLSGTNMTDDCFQFLGKVGQIHSLSLNQTEVTDRGLLLLSSMRSLRSLSIVDTPVTLEGISRLADLNLESVGFLSSDMPDFGPMAEELASRLPKLTGLIIGGTEISPEQITALRVFRPLRTLDLLNNSLPYVSMEAMPSLHGLENLVCSGSGIGDWHLGFLKAARDLKYLYIPNAGVTDGGILSLRNCRKLKYLDVSNSPYVSDAGATALEHVTGGLVIIH